MASAGREPKKTTPYQRGRVLIDEAVLLTTSGPLFTTPIQPAYRRQGREEMNTLPKNLFVGCDVSTKNNTVCLMDEEGKKIGYQTFPNTLSGARALESWLLKVMNEKGGSNLKMATEVTSFLDLHLVDFMASSQNGRLRKKSISLCFVIPCLTRNPVFPNSSGYRLSPV